MKIALAYPKIPGGKDCPLKSCIAFEKYDGTNLHWNWDQKNGWVSFGTRRDQFDLSIEGIKEFHNYHLGLNDCVNLFEAIIKPLEKTLFVGKYSVCKSITVFTEYFGPNSFAGSHDKDDVKKLVCIDVNTNLGMVPPSQFCMDYGCGMYLSLDNFPKMVYSGKYTGQFVEDVRRGKFNVGEGVVCKGLINGEVYMTKIKTNAYLEKLKKVYPKEWKNYWE